MLFGDKNQIVYENFCFEKNQILARINGLDGFLPFIHHSDNSGSLSIVLLPKFVAFSSSVLSEQGGVSLNFVHEWPVIFILSNAFITVLLSDAPAVDIFPSSRKILTILNIKHMHTVLQIMTGK